MNECLHYICFKDIKDTFDFIGCIVVQTKKCTQANFFDAKKHYIGLHPTITSLCTVVTFLFYLMHICNLYYADLFVHCVLFKEYQFQWGI